MKNHGVVGSGSILRSAAGLIAPGLSCVAAGLLKGLPILKAYVLFSVPACPATCSVPRRGTECRLAPLPAGLCPSALDLQWRRNRCGEEKQLSPLCLCCPCAWLCVFSAPYPVWMLEAWLQVAHCIVRHLTLLRGPLPRAVCITSTATELLMNSDFHLLLVVLNCFCTSRSLMSLQNVTREEQAWFCERQQRCSLVEKTLSCGLCSWLLFVINLDGNVTSDFSYCIMRTFVIFAI